MTISADHMLALYDVPTEMRKLADRCAKLSNELKRLDTGDDQVKHYAHRIAVHLADAATIIKTTPVPTLR